MRVESSQDVEFKGEYERILAGLSPDERLRLLGENFELRRQLNKKLDYRKAISELPPAKKLALLEDLRKRAQLLRGQRRTPALDSSPSLKVAGPSQKSTSTRKGRGSLGASRSKGSSLRFGGRATAGGVNYEVRVAASIAVKMLAGTQCLVWQGINGADISSITMQAPEPVDDIVVKLGENSEASVFISAKERSGAISASQKPPFSDTVESFVSQFLKLSNRARRKSRIVWAVPSSAGRALTSDLAVTIDTLRADAGDSLSKFLLSRQVRQVKALKSLITAAKSAWKKNTGRPANEAELIEFLRLVYIETYDFEQGAHLERQAEGELRNHVVADPKQSLSAWQKLEHFFSTADHRGILATPISLRHMLISEGIALKHPPDYSQDIGRLQELTARNLERLSEHAELPFGQTPGDAVHIPRRETLTALVTAAKSEDLLITGEPGCGKSGLIHELVKKLQESNLPTVLLLAEEVFFPQSTNSAKPLGLTHALDEVLANWPEGSPGFVITDALDAVRDADIQKQLRQLLVDVKNGRSGWTVIASVREFDLKFGRELRDAFPGTGVTDYASSDFIGVAHFHVTSLSEPELDDLAKNRSEIIPFIVAARTNPKSSNIHRSPFYLRLAAELLRDGVPQARLADWASPALLMRKFWEARVKGGAGERARELVLKSICRQMVSSRSMAISLKELSLGAQESGSVDELRSRGILTAPFVRVGTVVGADEIRFTHHLLHDYAVARSLIPETPGPFCRFAVREPLLAVFYRQSFLFALEELWDGAIDRAGFWEAALRLEGVAELHGLARILAPILAARRVEVLSDLQPLLTALDAENQKDSPAHKALLHLASGLQDASEDSIRTGAPGWCAFVDGVSCRLKQKPFVEWPLVQILARLNLIKVGRKNIEQLALNAAGRRILSHHIEQNISRQRQYPARIAIETVCQTFTASPIESEAALLSLLSPERLVQFPHDDMHALAESLKYLGTKGDIVVVKLFQAAFSQEPAPGQYEATGSLIMSMSFQTRDQWHMVHYTLAGYYEARQGENAALMTEVACIAWNAVVRRRIEKRSRAEQIFATIEFRGVTCDLIEDYSHIWGRSFEHEENRILSHFEELLRGWAAAGDIERLNAALDRFAVCNRTSLMWTVFLEAGAEHPATLGVMLDDVLREPLFLTHPDYAFGGTALLASLHRTGTEMQRKSLEKLILDLPKNVRLRDEGDRFPMPSWVEHAQNRVLGALDEAKIVLEAIRNLRKQRQKKEPLPQNRRPEGPRITSHTYSNEELVEKRGVDLKDPANKEMYQLQDALKPLVDHSKGTVDLAVIEHNWPVIEQCELALAKYSIDQPKMAQQLWGYLVGACENIVGHVTSWPNDDSRWQTIRRILLKASNDSLPTSGEEDANDDDTPSWGWPAPRIDAASGLPFLPFRLGVADEEVSAAIRHLSRDKSSALRFNLALRLWALEKPAPKLMWKLIDDCLAEETQFSVLDALAQTLDRLWESAPEQVKPRLRQIGQRATEGASYDRNIHNTLAHSYLFRFLRTGEAESEAFIASLVSECESERANKVLAALLHAVRAGGWLTAGDGSNPGSYADEVRGRAWDFFARLLLSAQTKLQESRQTWDELAKVKPKGHEDLKLVEEKMSRLLLLVDGLAMQLFFACRASEEESRKNKAELTQEQLRRFWREASPLLRRLVEEPHPHTAHQMVQTFQHLLPCSPGDIFLLAAKSIRNSASQARFQFESLAVGEVVHLIQRVLADYREIFRDPGPQNECLKALLAVLDLFVEAGWAEARQLTHRLEEIYR